MRFMPGLRAHPKPGTIAYSDSHTRTWIW